MDVASLIEKFGVLVEYVGLGTGEPRSETVRQQTGYSPLGFMFREILTRRSLTCSRTWSIQDTFGNLVPLHPSIDFLWLHYIAPNRKNKLPFITLDEFPLLSFLNNRLHLLGFDVFVQTPLTYARSELPHPST
jgi:hypothetical protein